MSITGLRCLVLLGDSDEDVLQTWSSAIAASGEGLSMHRITIDS